jgi:hypothetical protein
MQFALSLTFVQCLKAVSECSEEHPVSIINHEEIIDNIEPTVKSLIERLGGKYVGMTSEFCNRSKVKTCDIATSLCERRFHYQFVDTGDVHTHSDQLSNAYMYKYLHIIYEGEELEGGYLNFEECIGINKETMKLSCAVINFGRGRNGELATLNIGYTVYESVLMLNSYSLDSKPIFLLPFHPLEHFWGRAKGDTTEALLDFDDWYIRFRSLKIILENIGVKYDVIVGHRSWICEAPEQIDLQAYCASKVLDAFLKSEVNFSEEPKETNDKCEIINVEGAYSELLVTVVNWYKREKLTNTDIYYEVKGPAPIDKINQFCEKYGIESKIETKLIEEMKESSVARINDSIQRSLIF